MKKKIASKAVILYVLNVLKIYSSKEYPVSQTAICQYLNDLSITCERKTVGRNIGYLVSFGYPIKKVPNRGFYLDKQEMEKCENKLVL
jgi:biotin operon repressor